MLPAFSAPAGPAPSALPKSGRALSRRCRHSRMPSPHSWIGVLNDLFYAELYRRIGRVSMAPRAANDLVELRVENRCDPDRIVVSRITFISRVGGVVNEPIR